MCKHPPSTHRCHRAGSTNLSCDVILLLSSLLCRLLCLLTLEPMLLGILVLCCSLLLMLCSLPPHCLGSGVNQGLQGRSCMAIGPAAL